MSFARYFNRAQE
jgi:hypothetical protein